MAQGSDDVRSQLVELLMEKVEQDTYPSSTMLDLIEELLTPETLPAYAELLMDKMRDDTYPSTSMMKRLVALQ
jgi:hypothetical protein